MKAILMRTSNGLVGSTAEDHEAWLKFKRKLETMKTGSFLRFEWARPRNGKHHRKYFALLKLVTENSETYDTVEKALVAIKLATGRFDAILNPVTGELTQIPQSISYESMEQDEFEVFYEQSISAVINYICPQLDRNVADKLITLIIQGWG